MTMTTSTRVLALASVAALAQGLSMTDELADTLWWKQHYGNQTEAELGLGPPPSYHTTLVDHFDASNKDTWEQAYFVNDTYWKPGSDAPVFLCVGGEGPALTGAAVVASPHCNIAAEWLKETGALMFAVEHRYYGCHNMSACPVKHFLTKASLKFLSSRQALADLATFHTQALAKYGLTDKNKWVSFGGSYPGMLAGWFRIKYPQLVHASVASSAPVHAKVDMQGYNDVTAEAYSVADNGVGGSPACMEAIGKGHADIGAMFKTAAGRSKLSSLFGQKAEYYSKHANQANFAGNGVAAFPAQSNDPSCSFPGCNIKKICQVMTNTALGDEVARLAKLRQGQESWAGATLGRRPAADQGSFRDYWGYQTCTEFAFYQTCEVGSKCFYTQGYVTLADYLPMCKDNYGISAADVAANVNTTNAYYGGVAPAGSCVFYVNGEVDPWHSLSILKSPSAGIPVMMVPGASHHAWTHPSADIVQTSVMDARAKIRAQVTSFLADDCKV